MNKNKKKMKPNNAQAVEKKIKKVKQNHGLKMRSAVMILSIFRNTRLKKIDFHFSAL